MGILAGIPVHWAGGHPVGMAYAVTASNSIGVLLMFLFFRRIFSSIPETFLAAWIFFSPWSLHMSAALNPHFLIPLSMVWLMSLQSLHENRNLAWSGFGISASLFLVAQLHLSVAAMLLSTALAFPVLRLRLPKLRGIAAGAVVGSLSLIPWLFERLNEVSVAPGGSVISGNIQWNFNLSIPLQFLSRFLTFPTADVVRFFGQGHGYRNLNSFLSDTPLMIPIAVIALGGSAVLVWLSVQELIRWMRQIESRVEPGNFLTRLLILVLTATCGLFFLSIKGPSAHTFWIWFPMSFILPMRYFQRRSPTGYWWAYLASSSLFAVWGFWKASLVLPQIDRF